MKTRIRNLTLTKNSYQKLPEGISSLRIQNKYALTIKLKRFHFFILKYRQLLHKYYGDMKAKKASSMHRNMYKKKSRLNLSNYLCYLELKLSGILYNSLLMPKIRLLKQYILHGYVCVNNKKIKSYNFTIHPYDIISVEPDKKTASFLTNKILKKPILHKFSLLKEINLLKFKNKRIITNLVMPCKKKEARSQDHNFIKQDFFFKLYFLIYHANV